ncbi:MAG: hypothetical protein NXH79_00975 [Rhodobacteraceae bacterium]|nr:hypothetical protein [Paracoccaceae bacterium]
MIDKLVMFTFVGTLALMTFGVGLVLLAFYKKKQFHPDVHFIEKSRAINAELVKRHLRGAGYKLESGELPYVLINLYREEFMLFTDRAIYYSLCATSKIGEIRIVHGKLPLKQGREIKTRSTIFNNLDIMVGGEIIGAMTDGNVERIIFLLKCIAKDIREWSAANRAAV